jgi:hypothetical protein
VFCRKHEFAVFLQLLKTRKMPFNCRIIGCCPVYRPDISASAASSVCETAVEKNKAIVKAVKQKILSLFCRKIFIFDS